jgi:MoxR-like ATPase
MSSMNLDSVRQTVEQLQGEVRKAIVGQDDALELMLASLLVGGHVLLEGVPGTAKTLVTQAFAASLSLRFNRIQFTPDLMPGDVLGTNLFNFQTNEFVLTKGAIFTELLLADEINRSPPKTQAALLQAMNERMVTIDGRDYPLGDGFIVIATQNPIEQQGTYPLPEAQLDRFLFKIIVEYPEREQEIEIVRRHGSRSAMPRLADFGLNAVADLATLREIRSAIEQVTLSDEIVAYIVDLIRATRASASLQVGASPRAANMLASVSRAFAVLRGRDFVIPDDVKELALPTLRHRVTPNAAAEIEGLGVDRILRQIIDRTGAPR